MKEKTLTNRLKSFLWPERCVFCRRIQPDGGQICDMCAQKYPPADLRYYVFYERRTHGMVCASVYGYTDGIKQAIYRFKFRDRPGYARIFGKKMAETARKHLDYQGMDLVTCVPLSPKRQRVRGYNQSELLARVVAEELEKPFVHTLEKVGKNQEQHKLKGADRKKNVAGVYKSCASLEGKRVLLVDDIITTGNTVLECGKILRKAGASEVICLSLAHAL